MKHFEYCIGVAQTKHDTKNFPVNIFYRPDTDWDYLKLVWKLFDTCKLRADPVIEYEVTFFFADIPVLQQFRGWFGCTT